MFDLSVAIDVAVSEVVDRFFDKLGTSQLDGAIERIDVSARGAIYDAIGMTSCSAPFWFIVLAELCWWSEPEFKVFSFWTASIDTSRL